MGRLLAFGLASTNSRGRRQKLRKRQNQQIHRFIGSWGITQGPIFLNLMNNFRFPVNSFLCRESMLVTIVETLRGFILFTRDLIRSPELFVPTIKLLNQLAEEEHTPITLRDKLKEVSDFIANKVKEFNLLRWPLHIRKRSHAFGEHLVWCCRIPAFLHLLR